MIIWTVALLPILGILQLSPSTRGEASYRQYRILSDGSPFTYYYPSTRTQSVYVNPYTEYTQAQRYTSTPVVRYTQPIVSSNRYHDDKVYITDKYGRTTVASGAQARSYDPSRYTAMAPSASCTSGTCGQNAQCSTVGGRPVCSCFRGYMGDPLHHCRRAECLDNSECRGHQTCKNEHCVDPCAEICGSNANCETRNHIPICSCPAGYTGDPFSHCRRFDPSELCHPSPCGGNTHCEVVNGVPTCKCLPGFHGSPIAGCRHECEVSSECGGNLACIDFKCQNPCLSQCGTNAECEGVRNNAAICKCPRGYYGNPYASCQPECTTHSDCPPGKSACFYNSCKNPCEGVCGIGANCELRDITPICSCPRDMTGDPFVRCRPFEKRDLCEPNPCGANAQCQPGFDKYNKERPVCTCLPGYQGEPLRGCVRGECTEDAHCGDHQACVNYNCINPCIGQCGSNADCMARRHLAVCTCPPGYNGDALTNCYKVTEAAVSRRFYRHIIQMKEAEEAQQLKELMEEGKRIKEEIKTFEKDSKKEDKPEKKVEDKFVEKIEDKVVEKVEVSPAVIAKVGKQAIVEGNEKLEIVTPSNINEIVADVQETKKKH